IENLAQNALNGSSSDLGAAMPTIFMPTGQGVSLSEVIQFGEYTTDRGQTHMGVAPDFACGDLLYVPPALLTDPRTVVLGNCVFVNGYYLAIFTAGNGNGGYAGCLEAYDTWVDAKHLTFDQFQRGVLTANDALKLSLGSDQINQYITQSGQ